MSYYADAPRERGRMKSPVRAHPRPNEPRPVIASPEGADAPFLGDSNEGSDAIHA